jgi:alginate O-acetyltransferase complex protein AlgI
MLFNSYSFILIFLPITLLGYFVLNKWGKIQMAKSWLLLASLYFYSYWTINNLPILLTSIFFNFALTQKIVSMEDSSPKKNLLYLGLGFNILLLGFFKYSGLSFILPLGISFFTIQQIAYLVDTYQGMGHRKTFLDYALFVSFFPHITAGPIAYGQDLLPQIESSENKHFNLDHFSLGIFVFCMGLFKKVVIADTFSTWASPGFDEFATLDFLLAWKTSLSYTFQLYFDFCGYSEMAMGLGYMFNFRIAQNFNSPFKSKNIIEFWTRWHMTLGRFITTYLFTPFARAMPKMTFPYVMLSTFISMVIVGVWHGAGMTFALYGAMHGLALVANHIWKKKMKKRKMPPWLAWFITFNFVNFSFIFFRAKSMADVGKVLSGMLGLTGVIIPRVGIKSIGALKQFGWEVGTYLKPDDYLLLSMLIGAFLVVKYARNLMEYAKDFKPEPKIALLCATLFVLSLFGLNRVTEFIYAKF